MHNWRTRPDPFADVNDEIEDQLRRFPHLEAKTIFLGLCERYPGKFSPGQLRTLQRRVKNWRFNQVTFVADQMERIILNEEGNIDGW